VGYKTKTFVFAFVMLFFSGCGLVGHAVGAALADFSTSILDDSVAVTAVAMYYISHDQWPKKSSDLKDDCRKQCAKVMENTVFDQDGAAIVVLCWRIGLDGKGERRKIRVARPEKVPGNKYRVVGEYLKPYSGTLDLTIVVHNTEEIKKQKKSLVPMRASG